MNLQNGDLIYQGKTGDLKEVNVRAPFNINDMVQYYDGPDDTNYQDSPISCPYCNLLDELNLFDNNLICPKCLNQHTIIPKRLLPVKYGKILAVNVTYKSKINAKPTIQYYIQPYQKIDNTFIVDPMHDCRWILLHQFSELDLVIDNQGRNIIGEYSILPVETNAANIDTLYPNKVE